MALTKQRTPHTWQSAYNPIVFSFTSNRSPNMQDFIFQEPIYEITDDNGRAKIKTTSLDWSKFSDYVKINNNSLYSGIHKVAIESTAGGFSYLILDTAYSGSSTGGTVDIWLDNYSVIADVFLEETPYSDNFKKLIRINQRANPDGMFLFDLHSILNKYLKYELFGLPTPDGIRLATQSFKRYYIAYGDQYNLNGLYINGGEPLTVDSVGGCDPEDILNDGNLWSETGSGAAWTQDAGALKVSDTSSYIYKPITGAIAGRVYCVNFTVTLTGCEDSLFNFRLFVTGTNPDDPSEQFEVLNETIQPGAGTGRQICFTLPEGMTNISFKVTKEFLSECETEELVLDDIQMFLQGGDCTNILFAHNSTRQYNELIGISDQLDLYTVNGINSNRNFLTNFPRAYRKKIQAGEKEYLSFIAKVDAADAIRYQFYDKQGTLLSTTDTAIAIEDEGRYDMLVSDVSLTGVDHYSVTLYKDAIQVSERFWYRVDAKCHKYEYRLHWLNLLGAHDSHTFIGKAEHSTSVERMGEVKRNLYPDNFKPQLPQYEHTALNARDSIVINSGAVKKEVAEWLMGVAYSKAVVIEIDGNFFPVMVRTDNLKKYQDGEKNIEIELTIQYAFDKQIQAA